MFCMAFSPFPRALRALPISQGNVIILLLIPLRSLPPKLHCSRHTVPQRVSALHFCLSALFNDDLSCWGYIMSVTKEWTGRQRGGGGGGQWQGKNRSTRRPLPCYFAYRKSHMDGYGTAPKPANSLDRDTVPVLVVTKQRIQAYCNKI